MFKYLLFHVCCLIVITNTQIYDFNRYGNAGGLHNNFASNPQRHHYFNQFDNKRSKPEIRVYYESKCPDCVLFHVSLIKVVLLLGPYLDILTYPYGNAQTYDYGNGTIVFNCQHGPEECYGNKLHACAIDIIPNYQQALIFSGYLMEMDSTDAGVDQVGAMMQIYTEPIKYCAKSYRGSKLLEAYGIETHAQNINSVPHVILNGVTWNGIYDTFVNDVCAAFTSPPAACRSYL